MNFVIELKTKLEAIAQALSEADKIENSSIPQLAEFCGIPRTSLKSVADRGDTISRDMELKLAQKVGFDRNAAPWKDTRAIANAKFAGKNAWDKTIDRKDHGWQFGLYIREKILNQRTALFLQGGNPQNHNPAVTIEAFCGQGINPSERIPIFCKWMVDVEHLEDGMLYGHRTLQIVLKSHTKENDSKKACFDVQPIFATNKVREEINDTRLRSMGFVQTPIWEQTGTNTYIQGEFEVYDQALALLGLREFPALIDIELRAIAKDSVICNESGATLNDCKVANKTAIRKVLLDELAGERSENGAFITLASQTLAVELRAPSEGYM